VKYYKFLTKNNKGAYSGYDYTDYLPQGNKPGKWLPIVNDLVECASGYHACIIGDAVKWLEAICVEVEFKKEPIKADDKVLGNQMRIVRVIKSWNEQSARLFACDCAEHVLPIFEKVSPGDNRPRKAVEMARLFAEGRVTKEELAAAGEAAWAARAAGAAAGEAARAAGAAAGEAAWAAGAAGEAAAWAAGAAGAAAGAAEQSYQAQLLQKILEGMSDLARIEGNKWHLIFRRDAIPMMV
jgi:hypothetical protein